MLKNYFSKIFLKFFCKFFFEIFEIFLKKFFVKIMETGVHPTFSPPHLFAVKSIKYKSFKTQKR